MSQKEYPKGIVRANAFGALVSIKWRDDTNWCTADVDMETYKVIEPLLRAKYRNWGNVHKKIGKERFRWITIEELQEEKDSVPTVDSKPYFDEIHRMLNDMGAKRR